jgi:WD40 repeat protein
MYNKKMNLLVIITISISILGIIPILNLLNTEDNSEQNEKYEIGNFDFSRNFATFEGHGWRVREIAFSPDNKIVASGSSDGSILVWNISTGATILKLQNHHYGVIALEFSPSGKFLASGGIDNKVNIWEFPSGLLIKTISFATHGILDLKWSPDGNFLAIGGGEWMADINYGNKLDKLLQLIDVRTGDVIKSFKGHKDTVTSISFSKNGKYLISGSLDYTVKLWNVDTAEEIMSFDDHAKYVMHVEFSSDDKYIYSGSFDKMIKKWEISNGNLIKNFNINESIWSFTITPDDSIIAVASHPSESNYPSKYWEFFGEQSQTTIKLLDISSGNIVKTYNAHQNTIESIKFSKTGKILGTASWDWSIKLWGNNNEIQKIPQIDEWNTATPDDVGLNSTKLNESLAFLDKAPIHSLLIIKNGLLAYEKYFPSKTQNYTKEMKHTQFSATKSFISALIGIAIDKGFIESIDQKVVDFFPEKTFANQNEQKNRITIKHLLTMTMGINWNDGIDIWRMAVADDSVEYVLSKQMIEAPGTSFS